MCQPCHIIVENMGEKNWFSHGGFTVFKRFLSWNTFFQKLNFFRRCFQCLFIPLSFQLLFLISLSLWHTHALTHTHTHTNSRTRILFAMPSMSHLVYSKASHFFTFVIFSSRHGWVGNDDWNRFLSGKNFFWKLIIQSYP
jgi:hypothetical protein